MRRQFFSNLRTLLAVTLFFAAIANALIAQEAEPPRLLSDLLNEPDKPERPKNLKPVPAKADRDAKRAEIVDLFEPDAAKSQSEKMALGAEMYKAALESDEEPISQFVLLNLAREMACEGGSLKGAFAAMDELSARFDFPVDPVMVDSVVKVGNVKMSKAQQDDFLTRSAALVRHLFAKDEYTQASRVIKVIDKKAHGWLRRQAIDYAGELNTYCRRMNALHTAAKPAIQSLKAKPDDPAANDIAGRYFAFAKRDWQAGLALLANSGERAAASLAKADIEHPKDAAEQYKLAAAWWDLAKTAANDEDKEGMRARSGYWYGQAAFGLSGLPKAEAMSRLAELIDEGVEFEAYALAFGGADEKQLRKSAIVGGRGGGEFTDVEPDGHIIVGFHVTYRVGTIKTIQPVYRTAAGLRSGTKRGSDFGSAGSGSALANEGYAVGGIVAKGGNRLDGFRVVFMRIKGQRLDKRDWYAGPWLGGTGGGREFYLGGDGHPVIGIHGRSGADLDALGLVQFVPDSE